MRERERERDTHIVTPSNGVIEIPDPIVRVTPGQLGSSLSMDALDTLVSLRTTEQRPIDTCT